MARTLDSVTKRLGTRYKKWKSGEKQKNEDKDVFFNLANEELLRRPLARQTVDVVVKTEAEIPEYVDRYYPEWQVLAKQKNNSGFKVTLQENPKFKAFSFVNKELGLVFSRSAKKGEPTLDDEELQEKEPDLWDEITEEVRVPKEWEDLSPEQISRIQPYLYRKAPTMQLNAPKRATEEDLNG